MVQGNQSDSERNNRDGASTFGNVARQATDRMVDATESGVRNIAQRVHDSGQTVAASAQKFGASVESHSDSALSTVGEKITSFADSIRENSPAKESTIGSAAGAVADGLQVSGDYLRKNGISEITKDVTDVIRRNPIRSLWVGTGIGLLIGATLIRK